MTVICIKNAVRYIICSVICCNNRCIIIYTDNMVKIIKRIFTSAVWDVLEIYTTDIFIIALITTFVISLAETTVLTDVDRIEA